MTAPEPYTLVVDVSQYGAFTVEDVQRAVDACQEAVLARRFLAVLGQPPDGRISMRAACGVVTRLSLHGSTSKPPRVASTCVAADIELLPNECGRVAQGALESGEAKMGLVGSMGLDVARGTSILRFAGVSIRYQ